MCLDVVSYVCVIYVNYYDCVCDMYFRGFLLQAEDGIRVVVRSRGRGDVYKRQGREWS